MHPTVQCAHEAPSNPVPLFTFQHSKVTLSMIFLTISFHSPAHCTHPVPSNPIPLFTFHHTVLTVSRSSPTIPFQFPPSRAPYLPSRTVWNWYSILAFSAISAIRSGMKPVYLVPSFFTYGSSCSKIANLKFHSNKFEFKKFHRLPDREKCLQGVFLANRGLLPAATKLWPRLCFYSCCDSVHRGVCLSACWDTTPTAKETPLPRRPPCQGDPPPRRPPCQGDTPCQGDPPPRRPPTKETPYQGDPPC